MAVSTRTLILAGRLTALCAAAVTRGWSRHAALRAHETLWLYPSLCRNCSWHGPVITRFETAAREVWLTIDDGPDPETTPVLLDVLARFGATATFFCVGRNVSANRALTREIVAAGHTLGNHTDTHPSATWWALPRWKVGEEIERANHALRAATGQASLWFRSPVGMNNLSVHPTLARTGQLCVGWSADGLDGCPQAPSMVARRLGERMRPGAIVLLHDGPPARRREATLARVLESLGDDGYHCVLPEASALR